jgi:cytochrome c oxidase assembly factor CtaG
LSLGHWQIEPIQVAPALVLALAYAMRVRTLAAKGRPVRTARQASFYAGVAVMLFALVSPIDWLGENRVLWMHMVQHLLLGDIAALLLVFGLTGAILRPVLAIGWVRPLRVLAHPLVALPLWVVNLSVWHLRVLYQAALYHDGIHALEHFLFVACGALMWAAVIEPLPGPAWFGNGWKAVYTLTVRAAGAIIANAFIWASQPFYPYYVVRDRLEAISPVTDQRIAGAIMFIEGSVITMLAFAWLFIRFTHELELRQRLVELDLDEGRAARAARYGRAVHLREKA